MFTNETYLLLMVVIMNRIKLLIADNDHDFTEHLHKMLAYRNDILLIGIVDNANDALFHIQKYNPDVVLFDIIIPGMDGITFLRSMHSMKNDLISICCTAFYSSLSIEAARRFGVSYFLFKPVDFHSIYSAITNCYELSKAMRKPSLFRNEQTGNSSLLNLRIHNYIVSLGIPAKLIGCSYLTEAIRLAKEDPTLTANLSKGLYLEISRNMNSSPGRIERCVRSAIAVAYQRGTLHQFMAACPSNKEFINFILGNLDLHI